jgi:hypothetical protein
VFCSEFFFTKISICAACEQRPAQERGAQGAGEQEQGRSAGFRGVLLQRGHRKKIDEAVVRQSAGVSERHGALVPRALRHRKGLDGRPALDYFLLDHTPPATANVY